MQMNSNHIIIGKEKVKQITNNLKNEGETACQAACE